MVEPRVKNMNILSLGSSVGTNGTVMSGDVVVVKSFDDLNNKVNSCDCYARGKIVVFNYDYDKYNYFNNKNISNLSLLYLY